MSEKVMTKKFQLDYEDVQKFFEAYDYHSTDGWLTEILNGNIDTEKMRKAIFCFSIDEHEKCQKFVDEMFKEKWWEK